VTIGGLEGVDYAFERLATTQNGTEAKQVLRQVVLDGEDRMYILNAGAFASTYPSKVAVMERFFDSFTTSSLAS